MARRILARPDTELVGEVDPESRLAGWPPNLRMKGMFFGHLQEILGPDLDRVPLIEPPRAGRYLPFGDYPVFDHARLFMAAAFKKYPGVGKHEAMRRLARANYEQFLTSTVGQVMVSMTRNVHEALAKLPEALRMVHPVGQHRTTRTGDRSARIEFRGYVGWLDCTMIGTVESIVMRWAGPATIDVELLGELDADYHVSW